jgi:hypothetical protein
MRYSAITPFFVLASSLAQGIPADTQITTLPLHQEQVAVYRQALSEMQSYGPQDLVDLTGVLRPDEGDYATCMKNFLASPQPQQLHRLSRAFAHLNHMDLMSPQAAAERPFTYSPLRAYSNTEAPPKPDESHCRVNLSEIIFDARHRRASLNITVSCPAGGHSETHVYKLNHGKWMHSADCGSGLS